MRMRTRSLFCNGNAFSSLRTPSSYTASTSRAITISQRIAAILIEAARESYSHSRRLRIRRRLGILDAGVEQGDQRLAQALFDDVQLGQSQAAFLELTVQQALHEQVVDQLAQAVRRRRQERAAHHRR